MGKKKKEMLSKERLVEMLIEAKQQCVVNKIISHMKCRYQDGDFEFVITTENAWEFAGDLIYELESIDSSVLPSEGDDS